MHRLANMAMRFSATIFFLLFGNHLSAAQSIEGHLDQFIRADLLHNVVRIQGTCGRGFGLITARDDNYLFVATALHLLRDENGKNCSDSAAEKVHVWLYRDSRSWDSLEVQFPSSPEKGVEDLAVIKVFVPRTSSSMDRPHLLADHWRQRVVVEDPVIGAPVELTGKLDGIGYAGGSGTIALVENGRSILFDGLVGQPGQSGAPIATNRGFVGLYLGIGGQEKKIPLPDIRDTIINQLGSARWALLPVEPRPEPVDFCVRLKGVNPSELVVRGPNGQLSFDAQGCAHSATGQHYIAQSGLICSPPIFDLRPNSIGPYVVNVTCKGDPSGLWATPGQGYLTLYPIEEDLWRLQIDLPQNKGQILGNVTGQPPRLHLKDGLLAGHTPISGWIKLEGEGLHIDLTTETEFFKTEFKKE